MKKKILLLFIGVLIIGQLISQAFYDRVFYGEKNPSRQIISIITSELKKDNRLEVRKDIAPDVQKVIPLSSDREWAVEILKDAGFIFSPTVNPKNCPNVDKDKILVAMRRQSRFFSLSGSDVTLCLKENKVVDIHAYAFRDALL